MIKIVTVYNSLNPGSFFQATALYNILEQEIGNTSFLFTNTRKPVIEGIKKSLKLLSKGKINYSVKQFIMPFKYAKMLKKYNISKNIDADDINIIGSDEIWNVSRKEMSDYPIFFGVGLNQDRSISYAPSINNATIDEVAKYEFIKESLTKMYALSVRDSYSKKVLNKLVNRDIIELDDPTILMDKNYYIKQESKIIFDNYIFVYIAPTKITPEEIYEIKKYAKNNGKKLISYNIYHSWCDKVVYDSPTVFLSLIHNADCVFTSTFHGTIFSTIYNKQFVVFGENNKVSEFTKKINLNNHYLNNNIDKIIRSNFHYENINKYLEDSRNKSMDFLISNIEKIKINK